MSREPRRRLYGRRRHARTLRRIAFCRRGAQMPRVSSIAPRHFGNRTRALLAQGARVATRVCRLCAPEKRADDLFEPFGSAVPRACASPGFPSKISRSAAVHACVHVHGSSEDADAAPKDLVRAGQGRLEDLCSRTWPALSSRFVTGRNELTTTTEVSKNYAVEERLTNIDAKNTSQFIPDNGGDEEPTKTDKKPRTVVHRISGLDTRGSSCCGTRYGSNGNARPDYNYNRIPLETGRYPSQYNENHSIDRYGWQSRPSGPTGSGGRPGGGGSYGGSGNGVYAGSQSGDRYGPRPVYGSESSHRPNTLSYVPPGNAGGGYSGFGTSGYGGRPSGYGGGSYGISGTLADGDEFGPGDPAFSDGSGPQYPAASNINTQKAVALKALAGVALIGAAAALASNPILVPISIVSGRRKRSESFSEEDFREQPDTDYVLNMLKENLIKIQRYSSSNRLVVSPSCVARLTCEIQKDYLQHLGKNVEIVPDTRKHYFTDLLQNNVLNTAAVSRNVKDLIKVAIDVATEDKSCSIFSCNYVKKG